MKSGSWASYQAALPFEARAGGEPDDDPAPEVEVWTLPCPVCGKPTKGPAGGSEEEFCCSRECCTALDDKIAEQIERWRQEEIAMMEAAFVEGPCCVCGKTVKSLPPDFETGTAFCSKACADRRTVELWGSVENPLDDDVPW